jgi:hypothetical protein
VAHELRLHERAAGNVILSARAPVVTKPVFGDRNDYRWLGFYFRTRFYSPAFITKNRMVPGCWGAGMGVPYYALCLVGTAIPLIRARQKDRQRRCVGGSRCHSCSYDLTGNVGGVCPECGTAIVKGNA